MVNINKLTNTKKEIIIIYTLQLFFLAAYIFYLIFFLKSSLSLGLDIFLNVIYLVISLMISTIIHEGGHLIFGLITGYRFLSFKVLDLSMSKISGKISFNLEKSFVVGQCLMSINPKIDKSEIKYKLYQSGGILLNAFFLIIFLVSTIIYTLNTGEPSYILTSLVYINANLLVNNAIPANSQGLFNDALNIRLMNSDENIKYTLFNLLRLQQLLQSNQELSEEDRLLLKNDEIDIDFNFVHLYPFHYYDSLIRIIEGRKDAFDLIIKHNKRLKQYPSSYALLNTQLYLFYLLTHNISYRQIISNKFYRPTYAKTKDYCSIQFFNYSLIEYKEGRMNGSMVLSKLESIEKDKKTILLK